MVSVPFTDKLTTGFDPDWTVTDTGANISFVANRAMFDGGIGSPTWGDPGIVTSAITRSSLGAFVALIRLTNNSDDGPRVSLSPSNTNAAATGAATVTFDYPDLYGIWKSNLNRARAIDYRFILVPRPGGGFFRFISGGEYGTFPNASLVGISDSETDATLYGHIANRNSLFYLDRVDAIAPGSLPSSLTTRFGPSMAADDFDSGTTISGRSTPYGNRLWTTVSGSGAISGGNVAMASGTCVQASVTGGTPRIIEGTFSRTDAGSRVLMYFRGNNTDTGSWRVKGENDRVGLHNASGLVTQTGAGGSFFGTGVPFKLTVIDFGNHIEVLVNGVSFLQTDSTTGASNIRFGFGVENGTGVCYDIAAYPSSTTLTSAFGGTTSIPAGIDPATSTDAFTVGDGTSLATYGNGWTTASGTWEINTNRLRMTAVGNGVATKSTGPLGADHAIKADITTPNTTPNYGVGGEDWFPGVFARWTDSNNYIHARFLFQGNGAGVGSPEVEVWEHNGGVATLIGYTNLGTGNLLPNTTRNLRLAVYGREVAAHLDGELVVQAVTTLLTGGRVGVGVLDSGTKSGQPAFDNVEIRPTSSMRGDAVTKKALTRLGTFTSFLDGISGKAGFLGGAITEVGIPHAKADSSPPAAYIADVPQWQKLLDAWYAKADTDDLWVTAWSSGFFGDYNLAIHSNDSSYTTGTNIDKFFSPGAIDVVEAHPVPGGETYRRGVNVAGLEFGHKTPGFDNAHLGTHGTDYFAPTAGDAAALAARGITTVRLPISWERLQPTLLGALDTTYLGRITTFVNACQSNGIGVILDLHNYARYEYSDSGTKKVLVLRYEDGINLSSAGPTAEDAGKLGKNYLIDVWRRISEAYRTNAGVVAYEIMNEPHDVAPSAGSLSGTTLNDWNTGTVQSWVGGGGGVTVAHTTSTPYEGSGALRVSGTVGGGGGFTAFRAERGSVSGTGNVLRGRIRLNGSPGGTWQARFEWQNSSFSWQQGAATTLTAGTWVEVACDFSGNPIAGSALNLCVQVHSNNPTASQAVTYDLDLFERGSMTGAYTDAQAWEQISQAVVSDLRLRADDTSKRDTKTVLVPGHGWNVLGWNHQAAWITEPSTNPGTHVYVTHHYFDSEVDGDGEGAGTYDTSTKRYVHANTYALSQGFISDTIVYVAASAALSGPATRNIQTGAALRATNIRQIAPIAGLSKAGLTRQVGASLAVRRTNITRTVAASAAVGTLIGRQIAASSALSKTGLTRQVATSADLYHLPGSSPVLTSVTVTDILATSAVVRWTTAVPSDSTVAYGINPDTSQSVNSDLLVTSHVLSITGLLPNTVYKVVASSANSAGSGTATALTFTTLNYIPTLEDFPDNAYEAMRSWLPRFYSKRPGVIDEVLIAQGQEIDALNLAILSSLEQAFARTATWTLDIWEHDLGLPLIPGFTTSQRQDRIVSQLRGTGTATPAVVRSVAEAYEQGDIEIIEDFQGYHITIRFSSTRGLPASLIDLQRALRAIIPAHLEVTYEFTYVRWDEVDAALITWEDTDYNNLTWGEWERTQVFDHAP